MARSRLLASVLLVLLWAIAQSATPGLCAATAEIDERPDLAADASHSVNDAQPDASVRERFVVGTKDGAFVAGVGDYDEDASDLEVLVGDLGREAQHSGGFSSDADGDLDIILIGMQRNPSLDTEWGNIDADPEDREFVLFDLDLTPGRVVPLYFREGHDEIFDYDALLVGARGLRPSPCRGDFDAYPSDVEVVLEDPEAPPGASRAIDIDGDANPEIFLLGTQNLGTAICDRVKNGSEDAVETVVLRFPDPGLEIGSVYERDVDGDGEIDVRIFGTRDDRAEKRPVTRAQSPAGDHTIDIPAPPDEPVDAGN